MPATAAIDNETLDHLLSVVNNGVNIASPPRFESPPGAVTPRRVGARSAAENHRTREAPMPRYHFHLTDGKNVLSNHQGIDLASNAAARRRPGARRRPATGHEDAGLEMGRLARRHHG